MVNNDENILGSIDETYDCNDENIYTKEDIIKYLGPEYVPIKEDTLFQTENPLRSLIPKCYSDIRTTNININNLHEETLFYIFYNCPGDESQIRAFENLTRNKKYYFHIKFNVFVNFECSKKADNIKRKITYFDPVKWTKEEMMVVFDADFILNLRS